MKQIDATHLVNATAIVLLLSASIIFHVEQALSAKKDDQFFVNGGLSFPSLVYHGALRLSFPSMLFINENFSHHKPI
jgi:hypothetical protein